MESQSELPIFFGYHAKLAPLLWVFIGLATIELLVVHLLISFWSGTMAAMLSLLSLATILWLVLLIRSMKRLPVIVASDRLVMRSGSLSSVEITGTNIAAVRTNFPGDALKSGSVQNLALLSYPNVLVEMRAPLPKRRRRAIAAVAHCLEDPIGFAAAAEALRERCSAR
jgi:hypothetical protein